MIGNLGWKQTGVSSSLIEGFSFYTVLGMNINDTVGIGMDNYAGLRVGINGGLALDVNVAAAVRISHGAYYEWDETGKYRLTENNELVLVDEKAEFATSVKNIVTTEIQTITGRVTAITAGLASETATLKEIKCATSCTLSAPVVTLNGPGSLTAKTAGIMYFEAGNFAVIATASASIWAKGILKLQ